MTLGLRWGIKASLLAYISGLDDGEIEAVAPAMMRGEDFWFPAASAEGLEFAGAVRLRGHWGMLDIELREPLITILGPDRATLSVRDRGRSDRIPIADLTLESPDSADGTMTWAATLTGHGRQLTGGQYAVGTPLDPLRIEHADV